MALKLGYYPAQARLILDPTDFTSGGTDLGKVQSVHTASLTPELEFITDHLTGGSPVDARITGITAVYMIHLIDVSVDLLDVLFNHTNVDDSWEGFAGYNVGDFLGASQISKLLVRPVDDAGVADVTKPMLFIPRGVQMAAFNATWDRRAPVSSGWVLQVMALFDDALGSPVAYGDSADFTAIP